MQLITRNEAFTMFQAKEPDQFSVFLSLLVEANVLTCINQGEEYFVLDELKTIQYLIFDWFERPPNEFYDADLFSHGHVAKLEFKDGSILRLKKPNSTVPSAYYAALANLRDNTVLEESKVHLLNEREFLGDSRFEKISHAANQFVSHQVERSKTLESRRSSQFANSASYMGSKRNLSGFLVEALSSELPTSGKVLDLMCGSGAAASAFSTVWETYASDAMEFCLNLASAQGGGFSLEMGERLSSEISHSASAHSEDLCSRAVDILSKEDSLFHSELNSDLQSEYQRFLLETLVYPACGSFTGWNPTDQAERRKLDPRLRPYCLFTAYFANIYFGFRQCIEIDSLRFAIDQVTDPKCRSFAMGALIASCSSLATTYGGHFAQPVIRDPGKLSLASVRTLIEKRARSMFHEFDVRLRALSSESAQVRYPVRQIGGPWRRALADWKMLSKGESAVYVDSPYKREEYSRYYHVLETLVKYNYPSSTGKGRLPDRKKGELFQSEFFTRSTSKLETALTDLIISVLDTGSICAWSYSDSGVASIRNVLNSVCGKRSAKIKAFSAPFTYSGQGGKPAKSVRELLFIIRP